MNPLYPDTGSFRKWNKHKTEAIALFRKAHDTNRERAHDAIREIQKTCHVCGESL